MAPEYALGIDGDEFRPVLASWLDHPDAVDAGDGRPRLYAVSAAVRSSRCIVVRYAQPRTNNVAQYTIGGMRGPSGEGYVPASLLEAGETWARSQVPHPRTEPQDCLRVEEIEHFRDLWADRVDAVRSDAELIADGGHATGLQDDSEERLIYEYTERPYTGVRKRHITVEHRILANRYPGVGTDIRHEIRCEERGIDDWVLAEAWEMREHGIEHFKTDHGRGLP
jgi:hypothetical protein